jgi:hypothetical protein
MATFTSTITESVIINGANRGSSNTVSIAEITNVAEKVLECPANGEGTAITYIGNWASVVNPTGVKYQNYDFKDSEYIRVTNLSATVNLDVAFVSNGTDNQCEPPARAGADSCRFQLKPYQSAIMWDSQRGKLGEATEPNFNAPLTDLSYIVVCNRSTGEGALAANVELFVASKK